MSDYYVCDTCANGIGRDDGYFCCIAPGMGHIDARSKKVMHDHGHANGREPYDEALDVCRHFRLRYEKPRMAKTLEGLKEDA